MSTVDDLIALKVSPVDEAEQVITGLDSDGWFVYILSESADAAPFYIGMTSSLFSRLATHRRNPDCGGRMRHITVLRCKDEATARRVEWALIGKHQPVLNGNGVTRFRGTPAGRTTIRGVRVPDELWELAQATAADHGENLSSAIRAFLGEYLADSNASTIDAEADPALRSFV